MVSHWDEVLPLPFTNKQAFPLLFVGNLCRLSVDKENLSLCVEQNLPDSALRENQG